MYNGFLEVAPAAFDEVNSAETSRPGSRAVALLSFDEYKLIRAVETLSRSGDSSALMSFINSSTIEQLDVGTLIERVEPNFTHTCDGTTGSDDEM
jgi:hypothetical protein